MVADGGLTFGTLTLAGVESFAWRIFVSVLTAVIAPVVTRVVLTAAETLMERIYARWQRGRNPSK